MRRFILAVTLLSAGVCLAALEENDHRGSLGLTVATGGEISRAISFTAAENGYRIPIELGGTLAVSAHNEVRIAARVAPGISPQTVGLSFYAGLRNSYGLGLWKTFFDLEFAAHVTPFLAFGVRGGFGVQYDFLPIMGVYAQIGAQLGGATSLRLSGELLIGVQFRTYLFEP